MLNALFEFFSSVVVLAIFFLFVFILPVGIIVFTTISCIKNKKRNYPVKRRVLISCILEVVLIALISVAYHYIEEADMWFLIVFLCGGFSLLVMLAIAVPIIFVYKKYKTQDGRCNTGDGSMIER